MIDYCVTTLQNAATQPVALLFALLLGIVSAATSACCTLPAMGVLIGYSGAREENNRRAAFGAVIFFTTGTILSLMIIGGIAGFVGQTAQLSLGNSHAGHVCIRIQSPPGSCFTRSFSWQGSLHVEKSGYCHPPGIRGHSPVCRFLSPDIVLIHGPRPGASV